MRRRVASVGLLVVAAAVAAAVSFGADGTGWSWNDTSGKRSIQLTQSGAALFVGQVAAPIACANGENGGLSAYGASLSEGSGIPLAADGSFSYDGPGDDPGGPALKISGRVAGASVTGTYELTLTFQTASGATCRATSGSVNFDAECTDLCPEPKPKPHKRYVTLFPGVGIGARGLHMRGVAKLGMTVAKVRALNRRKPERVVSPPAIGRVKDVSLSYYYGSGTHGTFDFRGILGHKPRLGSIYISGSKIRTKKGITSTSAPSEVKRAYPAAHCKTAVGVDRSATQCTLRSGPASRRTTTVFAILEGGPYGPELDHVQIFR